MKRFVYNITIVEFLSLYIDLYCFFIRELKQLIGEDSLIKKIPRYPHNYLLQKNLRNGDSFYDSSILKAVNERIHQWTI